MSTQANTPIDLTLKAAAEVRRTHGCTCPYFDTDAADSNFLSPKDLKLIEEYM